MDKPRIKCDINGKIESINIPIWVKKGQMLVNRAYIEPYEKNSYTMYLSSLMLDPKDFGFPSVEEALELKKKTDSNIQSNP